MCQPVMILCPCLDRPVSESSRKANGWFLLFQVGPQTVDEVRQRRRPPAVPVEPKIINIHVIYLNNSFKPIILILALCCLTVFYMSRRDKQNVPDDFLL